MPGLPVGEVIIARGLIIFGWGIFTAAVCFSRKLFGLRRLAIGWFWKDPASVGISDFFGDKISSCFGLSLCSIFRRAPRASGCVGFREMTVSLDCALRRAMLLSCARGEPSSSLPILTRRGDVDELRLCCCAFNVDCHSGKLPGALVLRVTCTVLGCCGGELSSCLGELTGLIEFCWNALSICSI